MSPDQGLEIISQSVLTVITMVSVLILPSLVIGLLVSIFQTVTQIQEQTLSFLPRLIAILATLIFTGHWMVQQLAALFHQVFADIPGSIG
jgi:flagellar biosynthetic protein FliQ